MPFGLTSANFDSVAYRLECITLEIGLIRLTCLAVQWQVSLISKQNRRIVPQQ